MRAYHGDPKIKAMYLDRVRAHRVADQIVHGKYWKHGKGCAVGCTIHSSEHARYETELGIPRILARLEDGIFEGMTKGDSLEWPEQFLDAIPVGADLGMIWPRFAVWLLGDSEVGVIRHAKTARTKKAVQDVVDLYAEWVRTGERPARAAAASVAGRVTSAFTCAVYAAAAAADAYAYAAYAAYAAAAAAAAAADVYAAAAAADAYAYAAYAAYAAARLTARRQQADYLLTLLRNAPIAPCAEDTAEVRV
jgi:hypothetical protein